MFEVRSEAHGRVLSAVEDITSCCEVADYYEEWSDIAAFVYSGVCGGFICRTA